MVSVISNRLSNNHGFLGYLKNYLYCKLKSHIYWDLFLVFYYFTDLTDFCHCSTPPSFATPGPFMVFGVWQPEPMTSLESSVFFISLPFESKVCTLPPVWPHQCPCLRDSLSLQRFLMKCPATLSLSLCFKVDRDGFQHLRRQLPSSPEEGVGELCRLQIFSCLQPTGPPTPSSDPRCSLRETPPLSSQHQHGLFSSNHFVELWDYILRSI